MPSRRRRFAVRIVIALGASPLCVAPAGAIPLGFAVDPVQSTVSLVTPTSGLTLGFSPFTVTAPLIAQAGGGGVLPNGATSDGMVTSIGGVIAADVTLGTSLEFLPVASSIVLGPSGTWLPGLPGSFGTPAGAQLAAQFSSATLGIAGSAALRDVVLAISTPGAQALSPQGGGVFTLAGPQIVQTLAGFLDYDTNVGASGRTPFAGVASVASVATLTSVSATEIRLELPFDVTVVVPGTQFGGALPVQSATFRLAGQIVATAIVPEPSTGALVMSGVLAFCAWRRRDRRSA